MKSKHYPLYLALLTVFFLGSCGDDDPTGPIFSTDTFEGSFNINPNNFPAGGGLSLTLGDTGNVAQLDIETDFVWDIKIITYRTSMGGRPGILLFGDAETAGSVKALNVSANGGEGLASAGFDGFTTVTTAMQDALAADGVFGFDPTTDVDGSGKPDLALLTAAYGRLLIGDKIVNLTEAEQPVFLVQSRTGALFKFQMIRRENGGPTFLRWSRFAQDAIE